MRRFLQCIGHSEAEWGWGEPIWQIHLLIQQNQKFLLGEKIFGFFFIRVLAQTAGVIVPCFRCHSPSSLLLCRHHL